VLIDVTGNASVEAAAELVAEAGGLDVLINNAASPAAGRFRQPVSWPLVEGLCPRNDPSAARHLQRYMAAAESSAEALPVRGTVFGR